MRGVPSSLERFLRFIAATDDDLGTGFQELLGDPSPDALSATRDDHDLTRHVERIFHLCS